jgi:hypothetical protein
LTNIRISIETLVLVAVWKNPFVFQGCFKIIDQSRDTKKYIFFRCECNLSEKVDVIDQDFSPYDYQFTHLYNESELIQLDTQEHALYLLKYALRTTLVEMITNQRHYLVSIDDIAMQSIIKQIQPVLNQTIPWSQEDTGIGFAVSMDFCPEEEMGQAAVLDLLGMTGSKNTTIKGGTIH